MQILVSGSLVQKSRCCRCWGWDPQPMLLPEAQAMRKSSGWRPPRALLVHSMLHARPPAPNAVIAHLACKEQMFVDIAHG